MARTMNPIIMARWLAKNAVRAQWKAQGKQVKYIPIREVTEASNQYLIQHGPELIREAVIAAIRQGHKVNSIDPTELNRLIDGYLSQHPELRELAD